MFVSNSLVVEVVVVLSILLNLLMTMQLGVAVEAVTLKYGSELLI